MVEATVLRVWRRGHLQQQDFPIEFNKIIPTGPEVNKGDTQTEWFQFPCQESGLKIMEVETVNADSIAGMGGWRASKFRRLDMVLWVKTIV
jgi:hypothetical protein